MTQENVESFWENLLIIFVVSAYCLHLVRNLNIFFAATPILLSLLGGVFVPLNRKDNALNVEGLYVILSFVLVAMLASINSFIWYPEESYIHAYARYFYMFPFLLFIFLLRPTYDGYMLIFRVYLLFIVLGGFSLFYQSLFGPIAWFADSSERDGLVRFASLTGSLTSYGIAAGLALPMILISIKSHLLKFFLLTWIITSLLYTLQKAAVANIALFALYIAFFYNFKNRVLICTVISVLSLLSILAAYYFDFNYVVATVDNVLRFKDGFGTTSSTDVHILDSIVDRLWSLPSILYQKYGGYGFVFGVGLVAGSGFLGFPEYPMSHNGFFDLLFIGGVTYLLFFIFLITLVFYKLYKLYSLYKVRDKGVSNKISCMIFILFLLMINMLFAGVSYFHPYTGIVFFTIIVFSLNVSPRMVQQMSVREI